MVWAAEAYGSDAATVLGAVAATDPADRHRVRGLPDPRPDPGDDGHDGGHPGRRCPAAGSASASACPVRRSPRAGTASASTSRWVAPGSTCRSCAGDRSPKPVTADGRALHPAAARRTGQAAGADHAAACAGARPDLSGRGRPEEPGADRRDRRRLARDLLQPRTLGGLARASCRWASTGPDGDRLRHRAHGSGRGRRRHRALRRSRAAGAALYVGGMGSREQNFYNAAGRPDGLCGGGRRGAGPLPRTRTTPERPRRCRSSSSTRPRCSGRSSGSPSDSACWRHRASPPARSPLTGTRSRRGSRH